MSLTGLSKIVTKGKKRVGRGHGSGKVKTAGRGTKGQRARGTMPLGFEGGQLPIVKRLPLLRGKDRNKSRMSKPAVLTVGALEKLPVGTTVNLESLRKYHMIEADVVSVKILAGGSLSKRLTISVPYSKSARKAIEKARGTVTTPSKHE